MDPRLVLLVCHCQPLAPAGEYISGTQGTLTIECTIEHCDQEVDALAFFAVRELAVP